MLENEILNWFGSDPFEAGYILMEKSRQWENWDKNDRIGIKPNLVVAKKAESGATTHPEFAAGAIAFLQGKGFFNLTIMEGSWVGARTERAFKICGYYDLSKRYNVPLVDLQKDKSITCTGTNGGYLVCCSVLELDRLINMPVLKGHCQTSVTCALKNLKGCIPDSEKRRYHREGLYQPIADLNEIIHPDLILVDGLQGDPYFEEGGNPFKRNLFLAAVDPVLTDSYVTALLGLNPEDVPYIGKAADLGVGSALSKDSVINYLNKGERVEGSKQSALAERFKVHIHEKSACSACYASLLQSMVSLERNGKLPDEQVSIGQGFKDESVTGKGIGVCLNGASSFVEGCPPSPKAIQHFLET